MPTRIDKIRNFKDFWTAIIYITFGSIFLIISRDYPMGSTLKMGTAYFPTVLSSLKNIEFDIYFMALFGVLGYIFTKLDCEPAPMLLAFILGPLMEQYLRRAMLLSRGDPTVFFRRPISATLLTLAILALVVACIPALYNKREEAFREEP